MIATCEPTWDGTGDFRLTPNQCHPLRKGLVFAGLGRWPQSLWYDDASLFHYTGALVNMSPATGWVWDCELKRWVIALGASQYINVGNLPAFDFTAATGFTWSAWIKPAASQSSPDSAIFSKFGNGSSGWMLWYVSGNLRIYLAGGQRAIQNGTLPAGAWTHVCATWGDQPYWNYPKLYINGVLNVTGAEFGTAPDSSADTFQIGAYTYAGDRSFNGWIGSPMIWRRPLSEGEIQALAIPTNNTYAMGGMGLIEPAWSRPESLEIAGTTRIPWHLFGRSA